MQGAPRRNALLIAAALVALPVTVFGWWWRDARFEIGWDPDWPRTIRVAGEALEKFTSAASGEVGEGDRARAAERARWKAYYYAQLKAAERLGNLEITAQTAIRELDELDQELEASFDGTVRAAAEVESSVEYLDDSARARVVVEIPAESLVGFKTLIAEALRSGRISLERRSPAPAPRRVSAETTGTERPEAAEEPAVTAGSGGSAETEEVEREPDRRVPPPSPAPSFTGAAVFLGQDPELLGPASVLYELGGAELGTVLDLPSDRLTAGFFPVATAGDAEAIHRLAGDAPRRYQATLSGHDLFLTEPLASEEILRFRGWLRAGQIVLVLG